MAPRPTGTGIWSAELRYGDPAAAAEAATELEGLGYTALWLPDGGGDMFGALDRMLDATERITIATGVLSVWRATPAELLRWWDALALGRRDRVLLGLGVSHALLVGEEWGRPVATMEAYLDALDAGGLPPGSRCLAALGPRMLALARARSAGAHPYLVTVEHTAAARAALGDALLAVEQGVILDLDPDRGRELARRIVDGYCGLPNYVRSWKRLGFTDDDVAQRSDRLVDALVAYGDVDAIAARVAAHREAGADHVCIQVLQPPGAPLPLDAWRTLAPALTR